MTENEIREEEEPRRPVVVGVDRSENAARAARWAAREALARHAPLTVVNALDLPTDASLPLEPPEFALKERKAGVEFAESAAADLRAEFPGLEIVAEVSDLAPARTLNTLSSDAALLVTGTRGHGGFSGMLLGSVSRRLAAHAHTPLVVVRGYESEDLIDEVVLGVEDAESAAAIRFAFEAAQRYGSSLHAVRAWSPRPTYAAPAGPFFAEYEEFQADERKAVEQLLAPFHSSYPEVHVQITAARGNPVPVLVETARNTRLIVVGSHRRRGPLAVGAGYVVDGLLAHSPTPVAVVPITSTAAQ
ncbi:universal stress protein [Actinospica sp. MGRD01-02]|uniref:Universal stress protein n=1 Tax=Actinospica acidithermotolerans TaxID=2828514 RepID=A0A941E712_9ACTN|nr:universal stress protein [Actinospica acidithermotolerans]MBR7825632.1 universal stress protein [Actinospica acidithermotolerans]